MRRNLSIGLVLAAVASAGAAAGAQRGLTPWPEASPPSAAYRLIWSGSKDCAALLRYVQGRPGSGVSAVRWQWPHEAGVTLGGDVRDPELLRVGRLRTSGVSATFTNTQSPEPDRVERSSLALLSDDGRTQWPLVNGVVLRSMPNQASDGGQSPYLETCPSCKGGVRRFSPDFHRRSLHTDIVVAGGHAYQLYASKPAKYVSAYSLKATAGPETPSAACFITGK